MAGGLSRRMGQDKANMDWHGQSLLARAQQLLIGCEVESVLVSRNQPGFIGDIYPQSGPLGGIHAVMSQHRFDGYLFVPVDMPLLTENLMITLLKKGTSSQNICCYQASCLPIFIPYSTTVVSFIQQQLQNDGKRSITYMLEQFEHHKLPCAVPEKFKNLNSMEDWHQLI